MAYYGNYPSGLIYSNVGSAGGMLQLAACGTMTALLTGAPTLTYWRYRYLQYTNFALMSVVQCMDSVVAFGGQTQTKIQKVGDLLYFMYIVLNLPGIRACPGRAGGCGGPSQQFPYSQDGNNPCAQTDAQYFASVDGGVQSWLFTQYGSCGDYETDCAVTGCGAGGAGSCPSDPFAYWTNAIGQFIIKRASIMVGTQVIDTMYNDYLFMWEELAGKPGKRLTEMIGKYYCTDDLIAFSQAARILYVPLPFYFTQTPGNALPLVSIAFAPLNLIVQFESLRNCVIVSGPDVQVVKCNGGGQLQDNDLSAAIETCQVILDVLERDRFASTYFEQLITQVYAQYQCVCCTNTRINLTFAFTAIEFIFAVRRKCNERANNWFNYSGILGKEPLVAAGILFDTQERQCMRNANWYRLVQPYQFHTLLPDACIYNYSFSLYPEEPQPSGGATLTRLENVTLVLEFQEGLDQEDVTVIIFSRSYNLLKYRDGSCGLAFGS